ncbi:hypothetical protein [Nitratifractor salsuginis]|uniref:NnrS family protein n=1 Tax=Nitratifractor salsuginis (strain DSM 16511 / JCM 12458 / E9I37-1) TaxID=749222 RepID=E6WYN2_NITSE|nr:hypothetical protein [Nitratifractor salsuginis]ADV45403.1 hypothetical protein Nitsa_0130 [Nitratifractor salsuginis DSM 16511]
MFQNSGLSLDQAPPISVVLRFFLAGSLWGIAAGFWLLTRGAEALDPAAPTALILTHLFTLGVMLSFMLGALFQMLPVLAGIAFHDPVKLALRSQWPILFGTVLLLVAFGTMSPPLYLLAILLLGAGLLPVSWRMLRRLLELRSHSPSSRGMGFALFDLLLLFVVGLWMVAIFAGWTQRGELGALRQAHLGLGLFGWIALLIVSVSFQVIEMFYVTPPYPKAYARILPALISGVLVLELIAALYAPGLIPWCETLVALGLTVHALLTLRRLSQRQRPLADATVWFWRIGMASLALAMLLVLVGNFTDLSTPFRQSSYVLYTAFALSVVFAMAYKIVPFLTWFHLNAQGYFNAPMMHEVIHPRYAMRHLAIHLSALFVALVAPWSVGELWQLSGALLTLSFAWIALAIYRAWHKYMEVQASGERFEFPKM